MFAWLWVSVKNKASSHSSGLVFPKTNAPEVEAHLSDVLFNHVQYCPIYKLANPTFSKLHGPT